MPVFTHVINNLVFLRNERKRLSDNRAEFPETSHENTIAAKRFTENEPIRPCHTVAILSRETESFVLPRQASPPWFPLGGLAW